MDTTDDGASNDATALNKMMNAQKDEQEHREIILLFKTLRSLAIRNMEYFQDCSDSYRQRFHATFCLLYEHLELGVEELVIMLFEVAPKCDFGAIRANGYRSLILVIRKCCLIILRLAKYVSANCDSLLFRSGYYCRELETYVTCLGQLKSCCAYVKKLPEWSQEGDLFAKEEILERESPLIDALLKELETINMECFFGRCLGFQFCESMQKPLNGLNVALAWYSENYEKAELHGTSMSKFTSSLMSGGKYLMNPELRAQKVCNAVFNADVNFCKGFWNLAETEIVQTLPMIVCPPVRVSQVIDIQPEVYQMPSRDGTRLVTINPPSSHGDPGVIHTRLISHEFREGQEHLCPKDMFGHKSSPPSPCLIIHCHGGGWVAQSSKSHETYLRHWAKDLKVPILSIDYSLAPQFPYPRALEECIYTYAWAVDNCDWLGSTGEHICLVGDSAGGNLVIATALKAAELGIRMPDGIVAVYTPTLVRYVPGPSRLLATMDPLLPIGLLSRCLAAYAGLDESDIPDIPDSMTSSSYATPLSEFSTSPDKLSRASFLLGSDDIILELASSADENIDNESSSLNDSSSRSSSILTTAENCENNSVCDKSKTGTDMADCRNDSADGVDSGVSVSDFVVESDTDLKLPVVAGAAATNGCPSAKIDSEIEKSVSCSDIAETTAEANSSKKSAEFVAKPKVVNTHRRYSSDPVLLIDSRAYENTDSRSSPLVDSRSSPPADEVDYRASSVSTSSPSSLQTANEDLSNSLEAIPERPPQHLLNHRSATEPVVHFHRSSEELDITPSPDDDVTDGFMAFSSSITSKISSKLEYGNFSLSKLFGYKSSNRGIAKSSSTPALIAGSSPKKQPTTPQRVKPSSLLIKEDIQPRLYKYRHLPIPSDPLMSPWYASDQWLSQLPPIELVTSELDSLLDDSVMFAKRLQRIGNDVGLTVVKDLPHGFLNFVLISKEAKSASDVCVAKLRQLLLGKYKKYCDMTDSNSNPSDVR
ncbi:hormone-sensitive lipase-like [Tubulanus polymorphus]|uniref:hormone-sensitive lipase-like n=1 Tax=Tubulanus polymorphus TaxID=672921 RepID=UPI003DA401B9